MAEIGQIAFTLIMKLLDGIIKDVVKYNSLQFFERRKIERRIEDATAEVVEPLIPFLKQEHISEEQQIRLIETCINELKPLTKSSEKLFQGSLDGQKIFDELYADKSLPQVILEDNLKDPYTLLCPRIASLLCEIPSAVKDWEKEAWSESFRRFDEIAKQFRNLISKVDGMVDASLFESDQILTRVRRVLAQKIRFLDITCLRSESPISGNLDDFFVHPIISRIDNKKSLTFSSGEDSFLFFSSNRQKSILIGPPGAGKSTWAKWFQRESLSPNRNSLCVRVELRQLSNDSKPSLQNLFRQVVGKHLEEDITADRINKWLHNRQIIFIFDGFDEISPNQRDEVYEWINDLSLAVYDCPLIITSRPLSTNHLARFSDWSSWRIEEFDEPRIIDYIQRWYLHTPLLTDEIREIDAKALASEWKNDRTIGPLTSNPLLLSTLLMVNHLDGELPQGRSQIYKRYVEGMLGIWDTRRRVTATSINLTINQKHQIIRGLALGSIPVSGR